MNYNGYEILEISDKGELTSCIKIKTGIAPDGRVLSENLVVKNWDLKEEKSKKKNA